MVESPDPHACIPVVVAAPPTVRSPTDLAALPACADYVELRLDLLLRPEGPTIAAWVDAAPRPVIATVRSTSEGGAFDGTPEQAASLLREAHAEGAALLDTEPDVHPLLADLAQPVEIRILATHGWSRAELDVPDRFVRKVAVPVDDRDRWDRLGRRRGACRVPYGALGMARGAFVGTDGAQLLYGAAEDGAAVVDGQPPLRRLLDELRAGEVDPAAELFGLVGVPPAWSPSPALHNAVFRAEGRDALYVPLGVPLSEALRLPVRGLSVTAPHKTEALALAGSIGRRAERAGAANTLRFTPAGAAAHNTDVSGIEEHLGLAVAPRGAKAFVYGAGGYARAVVVALEALGYGVRVGARRPDRAAALGVEVVGTDYRRHVKDAIFVNATPAGIEPDELPFLTDSLAGLTVLDAPYRADGRDTALFARARAEGARRIHDGRALLVAQAIDQARLFGSTLDDDRLALVLRLAAASRTVWLLGLRGAGKTHVGEALVRYGRPFVDLDRVVERMGGGTVSQIVERDGWSGFRALERAALERVADRRGVVIATGGGVVEDGANVARLRDHDGLKVWLDISPARSGERVAASDRPPLPGTADPLAEARAAADRRRPRYEALADVRIDADDPSNVMSGVVASLRRAIR